LELDSTEAPALKVKDPLAPPVDTPVSRETEPEAPVDADPVFTSSLPLLVVESALES
jgi:hypothetical protein